MSCPVRKYPLRTPKNHRVPIPRWTLSLPEHVTTVYISYLGVQQHSDGEEATGAKAQAIRAIQACLGVVDGPSAFESFDLMEGNDPNDSVIWVTYWSDRAKHDAYLERLSLSSIHQQLPESGRALVGLWQETFASEVSRLETNYSGLDYLPGLARLPAAGTIEHTLSAYWGAARDRIPDSAHDLFPRAADIKSLDEKPNGKRQHLLGTNHANLVHIRSGQFWENCGQQEADAYEQKLEPTLRAGLRYLRDNSEETGGMGIRYLRNEKPRGEMIDRRERKESCGAGFFTNLEDLERWAHTHPSHLKIYRGALSHYKAFGDHRRFRTWHEVCVVREGAALFEYVNCTRDTGVIPFLPLTQQALV